MVQGHIYFLSTCMYVSIYMYIYSQYTHILWEQVFILYAINCDKSIW